MADIGSRPSLPPLLPVRHRMAMMAVGAAMMVLPGHGLSAQEPTTCVAQLNGVDVRRLAQPDDALEVDSGGVLAVRGTSVAPTTSLRVELSFPLLHWSLDVETYGAPTRRWEESVDVGDVAPWGVGLYRLTASTDTCRVTAWVRVTGRSALTTFAGVASASVLGGGVVLVVVALLRASRTGRGVGWAALGGALGGLGALGLSQQTGEAGITSTALVSWILAPAGGTTLLHAATTALGTGRRSGRDEASRPGPPPASAGSDRPWRAPPGPGDTAAPPPPRSAPRPSAPRDLAAPPPPSSPAPRPRPQPTVDPPREAHARLECPDAVVVAEQFDLVVGLAAEPVSGVVGDRLLRPPTSVGPYTLSVQVIADGFGLTGAGGWRRQLEVTAEAPHPVTALQLAAEPQAESVRPRTIQAIFSIEGQTIGMAVRSVAVVTSAETLAPARDAVASEAGGEAGTSMTIPTGVAVPDLTIRIVRAVSESDGRLLWTFESPHDVVLPDAPLASDIGDDPERFSKHLIDQVAAHEGRAGLASYLRGVGLTVADQVPAQLFDVLAAIARRIGGRPPSVFILSEEPHVPWELTVIEPPVVPGAPPFMSAQCDVGRWVLGQRRPKLPPPVSVPVESIAVVWGVYDRAQWRLLEAEAEAAAMTEVYKAVSVTAEEAAVLACLRGEPPADVLHFAIHGIYQPDQPREGLVLVDGTTLDPLVVKGTVLGGAPFVFLNACQVGSGSRVLGDYAGIAGAFLHAGAAGVVAPLWSIDDGTARDLALRFYQRTLVDRSSPASVLRQERARFSMDGEAVSATSLAYQFFGHPTMRLVKADEGATG